MAEWALNLQSNTDSGQRWRLALSALLPQTGPLRSRSGLLDSGGTVTLTGGMGVAVAAFRALIQGGGATQGGYLFVLDAPKALVFADGGAQARTDIIVARVYDAASDGSGQTKAAVEVIQGAGGGGVPATPAGAVKLAEAPIAAGLSAGAGGLGADPVDKRPPRLVAAGGVVPVANAADRDSLDAYDGLTVYRIDTGTTEIRATGAWKTYWQPAVEAASWANLALVNGWTNYDNSLYGPAVSRLVNGRVQLRGLVKSGSLGSTIAVLPAGQRPAFTLMFAVETGGSVHGRLDVQPDGAVKLQAGSTGWVSLSGVSFVAEA